MSSCYDFCLGLLSGGRWQKVVYTRNISKKENECAMRGTFENIKRKGLGSDAKFRQVCVSVPKTMKQERF